MPSAAERSFFAWTGCFRRDAASRYFFLRAWTAVFTRSGSASSVSSRRRSTTGFVFSAGFAFPRAVSSSSVRLVLHSFREVSIAEDISFSSALPVSMSPLMTRRRSCASSSVRTLAACFLSDSRADALNDAAFSDSPSFDSSSRRAWTAPPPLAAGFFTSFESSVDKSETRFCFAACAERSATICERDEASDATVSGWRPVFRHSARIVRADSGSASRRLLAAFRYLSKTAWRSSAAAEASANFVSTSPMRDNSASMGAGGSIDVISSDSFPSCFSSSAARLRSASAAARAATSCLTDEVSEATRSALIPVFPHSARMASAVSGSVSRTPRAADRYLSKIVRRSSVAAEAAANVVSTSPICESRTSTGAGGRIECISVDISAMRFSSAAARSAAVRSAVMRSSACLRRSARPGRSEKIPEARFIAWTASGFFPDAKKDSAVSNSLAAAARRYVSAVAFSPICASLSHMATNAAGSDSGVNALDASSRRATSSAVSWDLRRRACSSSCRLRAAVIRSSMPSVAENRFRISSKNSRALVGSLAKAASPEARNVSIQTDSIDDASVAMPSCRSPPRRPASSSVPDPGRMRGSSSRDRFRSRVRFASAAIMASIEALMLANPPAAVAFPGSICRARSYRPRAGEALPAAALARAFSERSSANLPRKGAMASEPPGSDSRSARVRTASWSWPAAICCSSWALSSVSSFVLSGLPRKSA
ncbi:MAG: hypothetical protein BWY66_01121 [bacterium ADurb.Bin374]|nr:MAG: hypothetical protein BWY66_01121 [bacterium ADurb.Bin374]